MTEKTMTHEDRNRLMALRIARAVADAGGRTFYVGGFVRDQQMGLVSKDVDIEVHGVTPLQLEAILGQLGEVLVMGASFGVFGLRGYDLDIAMPRSETATGRGGHKDFYVLVDPFIGPRQAAVRRDFTINALMEDVLTGEVLDYFGGLDDLRDGVIRHVSDRTFGEDPLRVLRAAQFAARFDFTVAPETMAIGASMNLAMLPSERIMGEMEKALVHGGRPSTFFRVLRQMGQLHDWFAPLETGEDRFALRMRRLDRAAAWRQSVSDPLSFMMAVLVSDMDRTKAGEFTSHLTNEADLTRYVMNMNELAGEPGRLYDTGAGENAYMQLFDHSRSPEELLMVAEVCGEDGKSVWQGMLSLYRKRMSVPGVMGRDLAQLGVKPGPAMGKILEQTHQMQLLGLSKEEALNRVKQRLSDVT